MKRLLLGLVCFDFLALAAVCTRDVAAPDDAVEVSTARPIQNAPFEMTAAEATPALPASGVQWFATWNNAQEEARRTGRPILLVAATPHCAGVSGMW
ncbi:MAG: hypothetical protein JNM56_19105 [Planctomycetia bacterium]|nr:hypothetical protein [Planctomycetia bacterium]